MQADTAPSDTKAISKLSPREKAGFWADELKQSGKMLDRFHKQGTRVVERYLDYRGDVGDIGIERAGTNFRLNLFHSNVKTQQDMMYGNLPIVEANRTNADANDDVARVAAEMMERILNLDIQAKGQSYDSVLRSVLQDRLLPGLGCARLRYEAEFEEVEIAEVKDMMGMVIQEATTETRLVSEDAPVEYYHWQDVRWGWSRSFAEIPWIAYRSYLSKEQVEERFSKEIANELKYKKQKISDDDSFGGEDTNDSPWQKAEVWEIWDKETKKVMWWADGANSLLDKKDDPLKLSNFFPCPPLFLANPTTSLYVPVSDFHLSQDLYNEVDILQTRISIITEAVKVVGVYDASEEGVKRMLNEGVENDLIPVDNWALFGEQGGLKGAIDWMPMMDIVNTLRELMQIRDQTIALLQQTSGMNDLMRGGLQNQYEGVGQSQIKAQFGSVQIQSLQDQFAQFASDLMQIKAEIISRHFDPQTIAKLANMQFSYDADKIPQSVELLKNPEECHIRIKIRPETMAMIDQAKLKADRTEFLNAMATFMQSAAPLLQAEPDSMPYMLKMLQWAMAGFKGSSEIEAVLDKAVDGAIQKLKQKAQQPEKPDPQQELEKAKIQGEMQKIQAKAQSDMQIRQQDLQADMQTAMASHQAKMAEIAATHEARMTEIMIKGQYDTQKTQTDTEANMTQSQYAAQAEVEKDQINAELDIEKEMVKSQAKITEIAAQSEAAITEMIAQAGMQEDEDDAELDSD